MSLIDNRAFSFYAYHYSSYHHINYDQKTKKIPKQVSNPVLNFSLKNQELVHHK